MNKFVWLFGENEGNTANNNSFYFWEQVVLKDDNIEKYFILNKNDKNIKIVSNLDSNIRRFVVWKNSPKHWILFEKADMFFVTLSFKDVTPDKLAGKHLKRVPHAPIIYLQHGTLAIKKLGYMGNFYNNNFFRFCIYNKLIIEQFEKENDFKPYQIYYNPYHPRYKELLRRSKSINKSKKEILYFLTWRDYLEDGKSALKLINNIKKLVTNEKLISYLKENNYVFKICAHQFFSSNGLDEVETLIDKEIFKIESSNKVDVMNELASSDLLITDYSSVGFDFTFLNKPVILFCPDIDKYLKDRETYCTKEELLKYSITDLNVLVKTLVSGKYQINKFFKKGLPKDIDYDYVINGKHIDEANDYFKEKCENKISFLGYRFGGSGGTVTATKSLVDGLLEKGYLVEFVSLRATYKDKTPFPYGCNEKKLSMRNRNIITRTYEKFKTDVRINNKLYYLNYDSSKNYLPYDMGSRIKRYLNNTNSKTVVSTRETLHPFIVENKNTNIKNKVYFFHTDASSALKTFPNIDRILNGNVYDKCAFVTKTNYNKYKKEFDLNIENYSIIGNCVLNNNIVDPNKIKGISKKKVYNGIVLLRLSSDREKDILNIISFGNYLKVNKYNNVKLDVYGDGNYSNKFINLIKKNRLGKIIKYCGVTKTSCEEIRHHDFLVDFSIYQSFGMIYLEAILNGKPVFCTHNDGSNEVLCDIKNSFYETYEELYNKIINLNEYTKEILTENYNNIYSKYSEESISNKFIDLINK